MKPYYEHGGITIYHGDCREILPQLGRFDLLLTDPPYGVNYESNRAVGRGYIPISNDGARLSLRLYRTVLPLLKVEHVLWFTRWDAWPDVWGEIGQYFPLRGLLVWDKGTPGMGDLAHWGLSYELIASAGVGKIIGNRDGSILKFGMASAVNREHPTEKPNDLLEYLIGKFNYQSVLDPFMGSGTTLVAAKNLGRRACGIELEESYCEIAAKRLAQEVLDFA
jgi:site-specific DNA-methyltransferase (adenine-specific)